MTERYDANSAVLTRELNYIRKQTENKFRPNKWARLLPISEDVPRWAETVETQHVTQFANFKQIQSAQTEFPQPTEQREATSIRTLTMGAAYTVLDLELEAAERTGINVSARRPLANQRKSETILDYIGALGQLPDGFQVPGMTGLLNQATGADAASLVVAGTKTGGGVAWSANATFTEVLDDMHAILHGVQTGSKENHVASQVVMPLVKLQYISRKRDTLGSNGSTVLAAFLDETNGDVAVDSWEKSVTAGAGSTTRMCAYERSSDVVEMLMLQTLTSQPPLRQHMGFEVVQWFKTGGVRSESPTGIAYMDGI